MGAIYHEGDPYSKQMVVDTALSKVSNNPLKNRIVTGLVDDVIAPVEGANASQDYSAGDELILNNLLYKAKSAIAQDTPFDAGSSGNIELAGSIVDQLKSLFDDEDLLKKTGGSVSDVNTIIPEIGLRYYVYTTNSNGAPTTDGGVLVNMTRQHTLANGYQIVQLAFLMQSNVIYYRRMYNNTAWPTTAPYGWTRALKVEEYTHVITANEILDSDVTINIGANTYYTIKNGWCYLQLFGVSAVDTALHTDALYLPIPLGGNVYIDSIRTDGTATGGLMINGSSGKTRIQMSVPNKTVNIKGSYPIA